jgi:hypothetical protein
MTGPIRPYMSMSLDGFITGPDDRKGQGLGRNGGRLFNWLDDRRSDGPSGRVYREAGATGDRGVLVHGAGAPPTRRTSNWNSSDGWRTAT